VQAGRKHGGVFDRLRCTLREDREHGVRGIAKKADATLGPTFNTPISTHARRRLPVPLPPAPQTEKACPEESS